MRLSQKQATVMNYVREHGWIDLTKATYLPGFGYYCNERKHTGALLSNMVKRGLLVRTKPGVFEAPKRKQEEASFQLEG